MVRSELSQASILKGLRTGFVGQSLLYYPTLNSTMDTARQVAREGAAEGTVVLAEQQTGGRGRLGRRWISPPGSVSLSIILRPTLIPLTHLIMVASLAVTHSIETVTSLSTQIKWPNDILIRGKKVAGILTEGELRGNGVDFVIIGIGLNINLDPATLPQIPATATSLSQELRREVPPTRLVQCLLSETEKLYLAASGGEPLHQEWQQRLETLGKRVRVKFGKTVEVGYAESVDSDGSLLLRHPDGTLVRIVAGDITLHD